MVDLLLLESGDRLLTELGDNIELEHSTYSKTFTFGAKLVLQTVEPSFLLKEDGDDILLESGFKILLESETTASPQFTFGAALQKELTKDPISFVSDIETDVYYSGLVTLIDIEIPVKP